MPASVPPFAQLSAPAEWRRVDFISDLHLQESEPATFRAWCDYMAGTEADAVFILGDLFEVWLGDDAAPRRLAEAAGDERFEARCARVMRDAAERLEVLFMRGNRDFLVGSQYLALCHARDLADPTVFSFAGQRWLLSHGDALCLDDLDYMHFRAQVRSPAWQREFLAKPLAERTVIARQLRTQSEAHKKTGAIYADADPAASRQWLRAAASATLIHGHTHKPADHDLGQGLQRVVLSDWEATAKPPRAQVLRLSVSGLQRLDLA